MKKLWVRVGVELFLTDEEVNEIFSGSEKGGELIKRIIMEHWGRVCGDTYVPAESVEQFNETYGTDYTCKIYGWDIGEN